MEPAMMRLCMTIMMMVLDINVDDDDDEKTMLSLCVALMAYHK